MKKIFLILWSLFVLINVSAQTATTLNNGCVKSAKILRDGSRLVVSFEMSLSELEVKNQNAFVFTPYICNEENSTDLKSVGVYGKHRYLYYLRNGKGAMLTGKEEISFKASDVPDTFCYEESVTFEPWMKNCKLMINNEEYACCRQLVSQHFQEVGGYREITYKPQFVYVSPKVETVKSRSLSGSAYIDFPVSKTAILPDYRNNQVELDKIIATINSVKQDKDVTITSIEIKGYASPEGTYAGNERLAKGRVESLCKYVALLNPQQKNLIKTDYEPEDWEGLRNFVADSGLEHRSEILDLIDGTLAPDKKEWNIKSKFPSDYSYLLKACYPALRHSDYRVAYIIRSYTDVEEIKRLVRENPKNLSLQEFYQAAQSYQQGSEGFNDVFDIAVRLYPNDEIANLNAGNIAMSKGDMTLAARYLERAGSTASAVYARGVYKALCKDYEQAVVLFEQADEAGIKEAAEALKVVRELLNE